MRKRILVFVASGSALASGLLAPSSLVTNIALADAGDTVVVGQVTREKAGTSQSIPNAQIDLLWIPDLAVPNDTGHYKVVVVDTAKSDADGRYTLSAPPTAKMVEEAGTNDGWLNFDLEIRTTEGEAISTGISRALVDGTWTGKDRDEFQPTAPALTTFTYDTNGTLQNGFQVEPLPSGLLPSAETCGLEWVVDKRWSQSTRVINFHNSSHADSSWVYGQTADSDVDVGVSVGGSTWKTSGSRHVGSSHGTTSGGSTGNDYDRFGRTDFQYEKGHWSGGRLGCIPYYKIRAIGWNGGVADDGNTLRYCSESALYRYKADYATGSRLDRTDTRATRIGFAIDTGPVNLGGTSGYSTYVEMHWFMRRGRVRFCGLNNFPARDDPGPGVIYNNNL